MFPHLAPLSLRVVSCMMALLLCLEAAGEPPAKERAATQPVRFILEGRLQVLACSPDGKTLAAGTPLEIVCLWDTSTGKLARRLQAGVSASFSPDGRWLVAVTHDGRIRRFEYPACKLIGRADPDHRADYLYVTHVAFAPDGKLIALSD